MVRVTRRIQRTIDAEAVKINLLCTSTATLHSGDLERIGAMRQAAQAHNRNVIGGLDSLIIRSARVAVLHNGVHGEHLYQSIVTAHHADHQRAGIRCRTGIDVNTRTGEGEGRSARTGGQLHGRTIGVANCARIRIVIAVVSLGANDRSRLRQILRRSFGCNIFSASRIWHCKAFLVVHRRGGVDVDLVSGTAAIARQGQLECLNALEHLSGCIGEVFVSSIVFDRAVLRSGQRGRSPVAANTKVFSLDLHRQAEVHHEGMSVIKGVVQVNVLAVLAAFDLDAGVIAVAVLRADGGHGGEVSGDGLGLVQIVGYRAIGQVTLPGVCQADVLIKQGAALHSNVIAIEFRIRSLVNVVNSQRIVSGFYSEVIGKENSLLRIELHHRDCGIPADMVVFLILCHLGAFRNAGLIINPDDLLIRGIIIFGIITSILRSTADTCAAEPYADCRNHVNLICVRGFHLNIVNISSRAVIIANRVI